MSEHNNHKIQLIIEGPVKKINKQDKVKIKKVVESVLLDNKELNLKVSGIQGLNNRTLHILEVTLLDKGGPSISGSFFWALLGKIKREIYDITNIQTKAPTFLTSNMLEENLYHSNVVIVEKLMNRKNIPKKKISSPKKRIVSQRKKASSTKSKTSTSKRKVLP